METKGFFDAFPNHIRSSMDIVITVNKDDMKNPLIGTKEHPIPVFRAVGDEEPISIFHYNDKGNKITETYDISQAQ